VLEQKHSVGAKVKACGGKGNHQDCNWN